MAIILFRIIFTICIVNNSIFTLPVTVRCIRIGGVLLLVLGQRGFLVKMQVISPNHSGMNLVERVRQSLLARWARGILADTRHFPECAPPGFPYGRLQFLRNLQPRYIRKWR